MPAVADDAGDACKPRHSPVAPAVSEALGTLDFIRKSGISNPEDSNSLIADEAVNTHMIGEYIRARESYYPDSYNNYFGYNLVRVFSEPASFGKYQKQIMLKNPESTGARLGTKGSRKVRIENVTFLSKLMLTGDEAHSYRVKLHIDETGASGQKSFEKTVIIAMKYTPLELSTDDRCLNPVNFRVFSYDNMQPAP